ncbi:MAG: PEP-CTERM sorting domain-containing protein [Fimbriimonadaceae bacterium]
MNYKKTLSVIALAAIACIAIAQERLIVTDSNDRYFSVDPVTGAATQIGTLTGGGFGIAAGLGYDPGSGTMYSADSSVDSLYTMDINTGAMTLIGAFNRPGIDPVMHGLEFNTTNGKLYGLDFRDKGLVEIDVNTGQATLIGITAATSFASLAWDANAGIMYMGDAGTDSLYTVDLATGASTLIGATGIVGSLGTGMAWSPTYGLLGIDNSTDALYRFDTTTGAATLIGALGGGATNPLGLAVVPEPGTMIALGAGLAALAARRRRK